MSQITIPPARTVEARQKQLQMGLTSTFGRGSNGGTSPLPDGSSWIPHTGKRQAFRALNQAWRRFEKRAKKGTHADSTRERLLDWCSESTSSVVEAEFMAKAIVLSAQVQSEKDGKDFVDLINLALNEAEKGAKSTEQSEAENYATVAAAEVPNA